MCALVPPPTLGNRHRRRKGGPRRGSLTCFLEPSCGGGFELRVSEKMARRAWLQSSSVAKNSPASTQSPRSAVESSGARPKVARRTAQDADCIPHACF